MKEAVVGVTRAAEIEMLYAIQILLKGRYIAQAVSPEVVQLRYILKRNPLHLS